MFVVQEVFEACQYVQDSGEAGWVTCIDYLIASTEYESFMNLSYDYHEMFVFDPTPETEWNPPPEDAGDDSQGLPGA
jgi:hypothetical protein